MVGAVSMPQQLNWNGDSDIEAMQSHEKKTGLKERTQLVLPPGVAAIREKQTIHLQDVVREAEKREKRRKERLSQTKTKENLAYLEKRFEKERRQEQRHIMQLAEDTKTLVKAAVALVHQEHCRGLAPAEERSISESQRICHSSGGSTKSFAILNPNVVRKNSDFISTQQMGFMKDVFKMLEIPEKKKTWGQREEQQRFPRSNSRQNSLVSNGKKMKAPQYTREQEKYQRGKTTPGSISNGRRKLLEEKRGVLLQLQGLIQKEAHTLDYLVANGKRQTQNLKGHKSWQIDRPSHSHHCTSTQQQGSEHRHRQKSINGGSSEGRSWRSDSIPAQTGACTSLNSVSNSFSSAKVSLSEPPYSLPPVIVGGGKAGVSAFFAGGGHWSKCEVDDRRSCSDRQQARGCPKSVSAPSLGGTHHISGRRPDASSVSYATYGSRYRGIEGTKCHGRRERPQNVPLLPIGRRL